LNGRVKVGFLLLSIVAMALMAWGSLLMVTEVLPGIGVVCVGFLVAGSGFFARARLRRGGADHA
jgi:membrane-bound ClpP family serine protease